MKYFEQVKSKFIDLDEVTEKVHIIDDQIAANFKKRSKIIIFSFTLVLYFLLAPRLFGQIEPKEIEDQRFYNYRGLIIEVAKEFEISPALVAATIKSESNFRPYVVSSAGAKGLMQLMPSTARLLKVKNIQDPEDNIRGGTKYLKQLIQEFNGNVRLAIAAYNAGPGAVRKHGEVPPYKETQRYVVKVLKYTKEFKEHFINSEA
ncbi:MAG: lytic transglycosylase domain-containing protein [Pseudomonadota bacterium]